MVTSTSNILFDGDRVSALVDWDKAEANFPSFELLRALHLGLQLRPELAIPFLEGYRSVSNLRDTTLSAAAAYYGFWLTILDQLWEFETAYLGGDDRSRRFFTQDPYQPFFERWDAAGIA